MKTIYYYETMSQAAPFFSEHNSGFVKATTAFRALKKVVKEYKHPIGLYSAVIKTCEVKSKLLARYLSPRAVASQIAEQKGVVLKEKGVVKYRDEVGNWIIVPTQKEKWENFEVC